MKLGVLAVVVLAAVAAPSAFAKVAHGRHAHHADGKVALPRQGAPAANKSPAANNAGERIDVDVPELSLPSRSGGRDTRPKFKIAKPDHSPARSSGDSGQYGPALRNALGQPVSPAIKPRPDGMRLEAKKQATNRGPIQGIAGAGTLNIGGANVRPRGSASLSSRGKIDGAGLIRPNLVSSVGGPAKFATGINGTLVRLKRR